MDKILKKKCIILLVCLFSFFSGKSFAFSPGISLSWGKGKPDHLKGLRIGLQDFWARTLFKQPGFNLNAYWDLSFARWLVSPNASTQAYSASNINILAISPVFRLETNNTYFLSSRFFLELGVGPSYLSSKYLGHRNLGGQFAFQDLLGFGFQWGTQPSWTLSYHYLHYSNASLFPPNQGIDVKYLITLAYQF